MEIGNGAVNVNFNAVSFLLCSIFTNNLINCQQQQQQTDCEVKLFYHSFILTIIYLIFIHLFNHLMLKVFQPSGWETGLDSSGVRTPTPLGLVSQGTKVTWTCPDSKRNIVDGKQSWVGECIESRCF